MTVHHRTFMLLVALATLATGTHVSAQGGANREQYTNKSRFKIPFRFDADELEQLGAREVELWESRDQGTTWKARDRIAPSAGKFQYEATETGSYWFCLKLIDRDRKLHPQTPPRAGLKVFVDLDLPEVDLQLSQRSPGTVQISWNVEDAALELNTLRLRIRQPQREWKEQTIRRVPTGSEDIRVEGTGMFEAELSVADLAGNETVAAKQLRIRPATSSPATTREKIAVRQRDPGGDRLDMASQFPGARRRTAQESTPEPALARNAPASPADEPGSRPTNVRRTATSDLRVTEARVSPPRTVRHVNTLQFELKYRLRDVDPDETIPVELWMTADGGASWQLAGRDDDGRSPMQVSVDQPGEYGVQLSWRSRSGRAMPRPQDGTAPRDLFIVDRRAPELELLGVQSTRSARGQVVTIRWKAADEHFGERPLRLLWSTSAQGPWDEAATEIPNDGEFAWQPAAHVPETIYVRLEARDLAGNLRIAESNRPVRLLAVTLDESDAAPTDTDRDEQPGEDSGG
jgi:hypothetical protein